MWDKFYVGLDLTGFENNGVQRPISRVTLRVDEERVLTAGDDTGFELAADCPHADQAMVNGLLAQLRGSEYKMYSAADVNIDPAAELGDGITASGLYSVIARIADDGSGFPGTSAPGEAELEDEYPSGGPMTRIIERKLAETRSSITKTAEEIRLQVDNMEDRVASVATRLDSITLSVVNGSTSSSITLKAGDTVISSQNITMNGLVTFKGLESGETTINGGCLKTGAIESMTIKSSTIESGTITGGTITGTAIKGGTFLSEFSYGSTNKRSVLIDEGCVRFYFNDREGGRVAGGDGAIVINSDSEVQLIAGDRYAPQIGIDSDFIFLGKTDLNLIDCNNDIEMHDNSILHTSDARLKTNIKESAVDALSVINAIRTVSFDWLADGKHENMGFIAQQLEGVSPDFVNVSRSDGHYSTKDMKLIPYLVKAVQELSEQIKNLKGTEQ